MNKYLRHKKIEELLLHNISVKIDTIVDQIGVSQSTIRRDLTEMESQGLLMVVSGEVIWNKDTGKVKQNPGSVQLHSVSQEKRRLAQCAAAMIRPGDSVFIDQGSTMLALAEAIPVDIPFFASTHDLRIAMALEEKENVSVYVIGGTLRNGFHSTFGDAENLPQIRYSKYFTSPGAISRQGELMYYHIPSINLHKRVHEMADETIVMATKEKIGKNGFVVMTTCEGISELIIEKGSDLSDIILPDGLNIIYA